MTESINRWTDLCTIIVTRRLGPIGLKFGASLVLVHLQRLPNGDFVLNAANTGLGDAILCHGSQATSLALPHNPATNREEIQRVVEQRGFISEVRNIEHCLKLSNTIPLILIIVLVQI